MLKFGQGIENRVQEDYRKLPFADADFDFVTAICVYHHVPVESRLMLTREIHRVLRPGGTFAMIEHNPYNPVTRLIVRRAPVDKEALLLKPAESREWMHLTGFSAHSSIFFLYFPEAIYSWVGNRTEHLLRHVPLGGQYAVFGTKSGSEPQAEGACCA